MKNKILLLIMAICIFIMPIKTLKAAGEGAGKEYTSTNLEETLAVEGIKKEFSNYKETNKQATIYLFRGNGCSFCQSFIKYLNSIADEYGQYFKVVSYEVWSDSKNAALMTEVSQFLGQTASGVPYIIIGDQVFPGYTESYNDSIKSAIMKLYESKDKYDVFEEMEKAKKEAEKGDSSTTSISVIICNFVFTVIGTVIILISVNKKYKKTNEKLNELQKQLSTTHKTTEVNKKDTPTKKTETDKKEKKEKSSKKTTQTKKEKKIKKEEI